MRGVYLSSFYDSELDIFGFWTVGPIEQWKCHLSKQMSKWQLGTINVDLKSQIFLFYVGLNSVQVDYNYVKASPQSQAAV